MREPIDSKELTGLLTTSAGSFAFAGETFEQVSALFAAIIKFLPEHGDARQLALLGEDLCDDRSETFIGLRNEFNAHAERFVNGGDRE